ncbi:Hypothetical protein A7982_07007 [Minicystis rosea]|nr:Hypothetical protein A7982_07007 [Minicystis rosea]
MFPQSVAGALAMIVPPGLSAGFWVVASLRERRARLAAVDAGGGARGDLVGAALVALGFAVLGIVPALVLRGLVHGLPADEALPPGDVRTLLILVPPMLTALLWAGAAGRAWQRSLRPGADRGSLGLRLAGLGTVLLGLGIVAFEMLVLRPRDIVPVYRTIPLWVVSIPLLLVGFGLLVEGAPRLADPFFPNTAAKRALGLTGLSLVALGVTWVVVSYFPHSNIPVVLPTVRAERFWYFPVIGSTLVLAVAFAALHEMEVRRRAARIVPAIFGVFILFQAVSAYRHAMDYRSDVDFWRATKDAVPRSAKAHLNYSVMKGARGDLQTRLDESKIAMELAPDWAMAHIYTGDTLCRMHRAPEAWEHYATGFHKGPDDLSLIALALQCLYDEKQLLDHEDELRSIAAAHEGSWIAYLAIDTLNNHEKNKGVDPKYRPRGYNDGPKE